jgi:hypothetical protein
MKTFSKFFLYGLFFLHLHFAVAQNAYVKWGATVSDEKQTKFNIIGEDEKSVYVLRFQHDKRDMSIPFFVALDRKTMQVTKEVAMQIPVPDDGDAAMNDVYYLQDKFAIMVTLTNRKSKMDAALAYIMDKDGKINSNYKIIMETKEAKNGYYNRTRFLISPDTTRFMATSFSSNDGVYNAAAFDSDLKEIWKSEIRLQDLLKMKYVSPTTIEMDMNADLNIILKASPKAFYSNLPASKWVVYQGKEKQLKVYDILPPPKLMVYETGQFICQKNGNSLFVGMYGEKDTDAKGAALASYKGGKFETGFKTFSDKFRSAFMSDAKAAKGGPVDYLTIDYVIPNPDNSFEVTMHKYAPRAFVSAVAIKFDKDLNEVWSAPLPIYFWRIDEYFSYIPMLTDKEICFIHNDHKKNAQITDPREASGLNDLDNSICVITRVNLSTGNVKKDVLPSTEDTYLMPVKCYQSNPKELLLFAKRKANVNFGKLFFD